MKINNFKTIFIYSFRIFKREFSSFLLPLISITFTTLIVATTLLLTKGSEDYILSKNREIVGGDIKIESNSKIKNQDLESIFGINIFAEKNIKSSEGISFSSLIEAKGGFSTVNVSVIDNVYPIYGEIILKNNIFKYLNEDEVYIDKNLAEKLNLNENDILKFNNYDYKIKGIIISSPDTLLAGFSFFPKIILSKEGFLKANIDISLFRSEYTLAISGINIKKENFQNINEKAKSLNYDVSFANQFSGGFIRGLEAVNKFVIIAVLISCVLASVNIYAGVLYIVKKLRKSLAILAAIGTKNISLVYIISLTLFYTLFISISLGFLSSVILYNFLQNYILTNYNILLPTSSLYYIFSVTGLLIVFTSLASFIPNLRGVLALSPKSLLSADEDIKSYKTKKELVLITFISFIPLLFITIFLLQDILLGIYSVLGILFLYLFLAFIFYIFILFLYKKRNNFNFFIRSIISIKYKDGLFGIVSVTSLYIALSSIASLILIQTTLFNFLNNDLSNKVPSLYLIDIQKSQIESLKKIEDKIILFPNVPARIVSIDDINVQEELNKEKPKFTRELGREFNLSYTDKLNENEKIKEGKGLSGILNEVSVDEEFANRVDIKLGSNIVFNLQGFEIVAKVTSLRETNRNSGLPFFYFLFNTKDLINFPATNFGYGYFNEEEINNLSKVLINNYPNVSTINTKEAGEIVINITKTLSLLVLLIAIPPLILSIFLVSTLIILSFTSKRKISAQLMALGAKSSFINKLFFIESSFFTAMSSLFAYLTAILATMIIAKNFLNLNSYQIYSHELFIILFAIIILIIIITFLLSIFDKRSLKELLSYEEN